MASVRQQLEYGVIFSVFVVLGVIFTEFLTVRMFLKAREVAPTTQGLVLASDYQEELYGTFTLKVLYEYRVDGQRYTSRQVRTRGNGSKHEEDIAPIVERFPAGSQPPVYYNPADPSDAYLEAGVSTMNYVIIVVPLLVGGVFLWAGLGDWKTLRRGKDKLG